MADYKLFTSTEDMGGYNPWTNPAYVIDSDEETYGNVELSDQGNLCNYLRCIPDGTYDIDKVRVIALVSTGECFITIRLKVGGNWQTIIDKQLITQGVLTEIILGATYAITTADGIELAVSSSHDGDGGFVYYFDFSEAPVIDIDYNIYRGQDGVIDYENIVATMAEADTQVSIAGQDLPPNTIWYFIRRKLSECELESADSPPCIVRIDAAGEMIGNTPNPPEHLTIERLAGGKFRLRWRYTPIDEEIAPTGFNIYADTGDGFDFDVPLDIVLYSRQFEFEWLSESFEDDLICRFCVRSYRTDAGESQNMNFVAARADSQGPDAVTGLLVTVEDA